MYYTNVRTELTARVDNFNQRAIISLLYAENGDKIMAKVFRNSSVKYTYNVVMLRNALRLQLDNAQKGK